MAISEGGHFVPPPHSSYIQKPRAIRVNCWPLLFQEYDYIWRLLAYHYNSRINKTKSLLDPE